MWTKIRCHVVKAQRHCYRGSLTLDHGLVFDPLCACACVCACVSVCIHVCAVCVCACARVCVRVCVYTCVLCVCACVRVCARVRVHVCECACVCACASMCTHLCCACVRMCVCARACPCVSTCVCACVRACVRVFTHLADPDVVHVLLVAQEPPLDAEAFRAHLSKRNRNASEITESYRKSTRLFVRRISRGSRQNQVKVHNFSRNFQCLTSCVTFHKHFGVFIRLICL